MRRIAPTRPDAARAAARREADRDALDEPVDVVLAALVVALIGFGVVMVYSASRGRRRRCSYQDPQFFLKRQAVYAVGRALRSSSSSARIDYHRLYKLTYPILGGVGAPARRCASSASVTAAAARRAGSRSVRSTSSPPRWRSSRSCSGSRTRSRRRPSR